MCFWPTLLKLGRITNLDMLFLVMGFFSLVDEIQFMLIVAFFDVGLIFTHVVLRFDPRCSKYLLDIQGSILNLLLRYKKVIKQTNKAYLIIQIALCPTKETKDQSSFDHLANQDEKREREKKNKRKENKSNQV